MNHLSIALLSSSIVFCTGIFGMFLGRRDIIIILISLELILLSANINFVFYSIQLDDLLGQIYGLLVLTVAAAETAIGLAIVIIYYRLRGSVSIDSINLLKS